MTVKIVAKCVLPQSNRLMLPESNTDVYIGVETSIFIPFS